MIYLQCEQEGVKVTNCYPKRHRVLAIVRTFDDFILTLTKFCVEHKLEPEDIRVQCSSSLDFAEEYTDDPAIVALCEQIRNHP